MSDMEKYAVIKLGSKQYLVHEGDVIELERQPQPVKIDVLLYSDGSKSILGEPEVRGISVKTSVLEEKLGKKIRVARFKKKSRYDKVKGHRQPVSIIKIEKIGADKDVKEEVVTEKVEKKPVKKEIKKEVKKEAVKKSATAKKPVKKESKSLKGSK